jgi:hypothetical protein
MAYDAGQGLQNFFGFGTDSIRRVGSQEARGRALQHFGNAGLEGASSAGAGYNGGYNSSPGSVNHSGNGYNSSGSASHNPFSGFAHMFDGGVTTYERPRNGNDPSRGSGYNSSLGNNNGYNPSAGQAHHSYNPFSGMFGGGGQNGGPNHPSTASTNHNPFHNPFSGLSQLFGGGSNSHSRDNVGPMMPMGMHPSPGSSPYDGAKEHFSKVDQLEQEVQVLEALKEVAHRQLEKALEAERAQGEEADGDLCVRVVEAELTDDEQVQRLRNKRVCIELECQGHPAKTYFHEGAKHLFWNETFDFPLPKEAMHVKEAYLRVAIMVVAGEEDAHGRLLCTRTEPVANLRDQRVQQRWCDFHNGWRVNLSLQWINSRSSLLQAHLDEFEARLTKEREKLMHVMDKVQHFVPNDVWHKPW